MIVTYSVAFCSFFTAVSFTLAIFHYFLVRKHNELATNYNDMRDLYYNTKKLYENLLSKKEETKDRPKSIELQEFLTDLLQGEALISVQRVDNSNLFMYSPREKI